MKLTLLTLLATVYAGTYTLDLNRYTQQCFTEPLKNGDRIEVGFAVVQTNGDDRLDLSVECCVI